MRPLVVVVVIPGRQGEISFCGVAPVSGLGPLAQCGLDEAFGLAVGLRALGPGAAVLQAHQLAGAAKLVRAIAAAVRSEPPAGMQIAPTTEASPTQNAADGSRTDGGATCDFIAGSMVTAQLDEVFDHQLG